MDNRVSVSCLFTEERYPTFYSQAPSLDVIDAAADTRIQDPSGLKTKISSGYGYILVIGDIQSLKLNGAFSIGYAISWISSVEKGS